MQLVAGGAVGGEDVHVRPVVGELRLQLGDAQFDGCDLASSRSSSDGARAPFAACASAPPAGPRRWRRSASRSRTGRPSRRRRSASARPRSRRAGREQRPAWPGRGRRAAACRGTPRAPPPAPRGSPGRGGSSARRARVGSRPRRRATRGRAVAARRRRGRRRRARASPSRRRETGRADLCLGSPEARFARRRTPARCRWPAAPARAGRSRRGRRRGRFGRRPVQLAPVQQRLEEGRLARAVRTYEPDVLASLDASSAPSSSGLSPAESTISSASSTTRPERGRAQELEAERAPALGQRLVLAARRGAFLLESADLRQLGLGLLRLALLVAEALDEPLEPLDVVGDAVDGLRRRSGSGRLLATPFVPGAGEELRPARRELEHCRRDRLEKPSVVRNQDDGGVEPRRVSAPAIPGCRRRGGWSARRAAADQGHRRARAPVRRA